MAMIDLWRPRRGSPLRTLHAASPIAEFARMQRDMETMFDRLFGDVGARAGHAFTPALDVVDCGGEVLVRADLPGLDRENIEIELQDGELTVRGERKDEHEEHDDRYHRYERWEGEFARTIDLPPGVDRDKIEAEFKNGVLEIHLPKKTEAGPKRIEVKGTTTGGETRETTETTETERKASLAPAQAEPTESKPQRQKS